VETNPNMTPGVLLSELLAQLNVAEPVGLDRKFGEICRVIKGTNYLIVVDEAERLSSNAMEYLRRIHDKAEVGVVLTGTEKLTALIKKAHGQFDQMRSRVGMWPVTIERITQDDSDEIARKYLASAEHGHGLELADGVLNALWAYCAGSARVLVEALVPALRDYATAGQPITEQLVDTVAQKVLFMVPRSTKGGAV
jgi:DNA transposition AAA+ family ATPase